MKKTILKTVATLSLTLCATYTNASERIISAGSAVTEIIFALEQQDKLVAVDVTSALPKDLELPKIGYHRRLSAEGLLALGANRLIGSDEMGPDTTLAQLKSAGVKVDVVNTKATPTGLLERIDEIALITGAEQQAEKLKRQVNQQIETLEANQPEVGKKVLFLLIHEGRPANVAGKDTTPNAIIELAGGINPAAEQLTSYKPMSTEAMVEMQPDVILVSGRSYDKMGGAEQILSKMPLLAATPAGKNKRIIKVDGHALVGGLGLKSLSEAERLSKLLN
ncbi:hemin ABC transporter substrate-binding protein [Vibrio sp. 16]|uniref:heme/hemin ABC transporter substrate-binding protein n=1 Tax=Vibrio sp. 16 TaxID=391586 RepID=UPI002FF40A61